MAYYRPPGPPADPIIVRDLTRQQDELRTQVRLQPLPQEPSSLPAATPLSPRRKLYYLFLWCCGFLP
ncbi:hypothetical protein [Hymenobacter sp. 5516J-16]|uniref:hypothetical protein n=1 Tax=Hymenobacter sp. 5516J-16 TaxID=2932253 RepID=UPI00293E37D8|nr:hypothetical protein [Hymenobacter sp. 5516J-16]